MEHDIDISQLERKVITEVLDVFRLDHSDWTGEHQRDVDSGHLIMISDPKVIKDGMKPNNDSLFNSKFKVPTDLDEKIVEYSCECGHVFGRYNEGVTCPDCASVVQIKYSIELLRRGWIDLVDYKIIVPAIYNKIRAYIGRKRLDEIILIDTSTTNEIKVDTSNPFKGIGMIEFEHRYLEILEFFRQSSNKPELYQILVDRKDITFSSKIYVMSSAHRPGFVSSRNKSFSYHNINAIFVKILTDLRIVHKGHRVGRKAVEVIGNIQSYLMQIHDLAIAKLLGKERLIRSHVISGRLWYSSRMVIISETETKDIDSVRMSYKGFIGMFEIEIINMMLKGYGDPHFARMTAAEARIYLTKCKYSNEINEKIFAICMMLIKERKDDGLYVLVDRNPSFDLGSIQCFKVADIFRDARNNVLTIPHNSLVEFNGDFDGDVLNVYSPKERCVIDAFKEGFMPSKLILDRSGGYFNANMSPIKDEFAFIRSFCDSNYEPISVEDIDLKSLEDIMSLLDEPFDYKELENRKILNDFVKSVDGEFFDTTTCLSFDPIDYMDEHRNGEEFIKLPQIYDPIDTMVHTPLCQNLFSVIDEDQFLPVK